jgi:alkylhydroperoxidase/carboxymuconolactone decarboxylase family protein YurZ
MLLSPPLLSVAYRYGVSDLEIQRMMAFIAPYVGFDKIFAGWGTWLGQ